MKRALAAAVLLIIASLPAAAVRPTAKAKEEAKRFGLDKLERAQRQAPRSGAKSDFSRFNSTQGGRWKMRIDPRTGTPEALSEGRTAPRAGPGVPRRRVTRRIPWRGARAQGRSHRGARRLTFA